jgi:hypothetical protein
MHWSGYVAAAVVAINAAWMLFDGSRALVVGDYITPHGERAGELGPWARVVRAVGLDPRSTGVKLAIAILGLITLVTAVGYASNAPGSRWGLVAGALACIWYAPTGTIAGVLAIAIVVVHAGCAAQVP